MSETPRNVVRNKTYELIRSKRGRHSLGDGPAFDGMHVGPASVRIGKTSDHTKRAHEVTFSNGRLISTH